MSPSKPKAKDITAFIQHAMIDDTKGMQKFLDAGMPVDARDKEGGTALMCATAFGSRKAFDWLLAHGADPRAVSKDGDCPLMYAISGGDAYMVEALVRRGVDVNTPIGEESQLPLIWASCFRSTRVPDVLIKAGADLNARREKDSQTALTLAIRNGNVPIAELLIKAGADVNLANGAGDTALDLARSGRYLDEKNEKRFEKHLVAAGARGGETGAIKQALVEAAKAGDAARVRELIAAGAPFDVADLLGYTPLLYAAEHGHAEAFFALAEAGANLHATVDNKEDGTGALEAAAHGGNVEIVRFLLKKRLPIEGRHKPEGGPFSRFTRNATPLICAAMSGHPAVVRLLLEAGANVKAKFAGQTALQYAKDDDHDEVVAILRGGGGKEPGEDPAIVEVGRFGVNATMPAYQKVVELLTELCGPPKKWKPEQDHGIQAPGVHRFTLKKVSSLAVRYGERDEGELLGKLLDEVRKAGFQIILTDMWGGTGSAKLALFPTGDRYAVVAAVGTNGANYGIDTGDIIEWLRETAKKDPFVLAGAGHDWVAGDFLKPVTDAKKLAKRMADFCPDSLDGDEFDTVAQLARALNGAEDFFLWWD